MKAIHQLVHTLSYGDAISTEVLSLQRALHELGFQSEIYAINIHPRLKGRAHDVRDVSRGSSDTFILHYSLGSPLNELFRSFTGKRALIHHNLTPPEWFDRVNPRVARDIRAGISEFPEMCRMSDLLIADSSYNASEIEQFGLNAHVLNLIPDPARWDIESNPGYTAQMQSTGGIHVLHVGRFAPNKCIEDIIRVFYFLRHFIEKNSTLWLPGIDIDTELYSFSVKRLIRELALEDHVRLVGQADDTELRAMYENSSVYLCMSEHEGFCLPAIEAMHFGLPVVAYASTALPDTIGTGGVLVSEKRHPEIAELLAQIARDAAFRSRLIAAGRARVVELSYENFKKRVADIVGLLAEERRVA